MADVAQAAAAWAAALEASAFGAWMRGDPWAYPVANVLHLFALVALVGAVLAMDARMLAGARRGAATVRDAFALAPTVRLLTRVAVAGALLALASGAALLAADAVALATNPAFRIKLALLALAAANALAFRFAWRASWRGFDQRLPAAARLQLWLSVALWLAIPVAGRLIAYL